MDRPQVLAQRYEVRSTLGEGGMGTVYRVADQLDGDKELALKTIKHAGEVTPEARLRFKEEFRAMARLRHPNTIAVYDFGQLDATSLYITMELVPGRELTEVMGGRQMPYAEIYPLLIQLLQALHFIHARLFVHRDIKSQNIRVRDDNTLKLMDFGLMGQLGQPSSRTVTGSPGYLAPEVAIGGIIDASSDLYSVGCLAYEMVTGRLPFEGSLAQVVRAHIGEKPKAMRELRADVPERLERIVLRLLDKEQSRRYRTAVDVLDDLAALAGVAIADENLDQRRSYLTTSVLVGRDRELAELDAALSSALSGTASAVMVQAPAGTGKSRLVQELLLQAKLNEVVVLHGTCVETGMAPYEALARALRPGLAHATAEEKDRHFDALARLFPDLASDCGAELPPIELENVAAAVLEWLQGVSSRVPLLWLMDDLHWADAPTLAVLNHCIRQMGDHRVLIVGTFRDDETPPGSAVWYTLEEGSSRALKLGPLTYESQNQLIEAMLGELELREGFAHALYGATGGNAFFLTEVLRALMEDELLARRAGRWRFPAEAAVLAPLTSMEETLKRRLGRLGQSARRLASVAAVLGRQQSIAILQAMTGQEDDELFAALEELESRQFLLRETGGHVFPHDRVREVLYERLDPNIRRALHQRAGEYYEQHPHGDPMHQLYELAHHFGHGTDLSKAYRYQREAGDRAAAAGCDATALDLWLAAEAVLGRLEMPNKARVQAELWLTIGSNAFVLRPRNAIVVLTKLAEALEVWSEPEWPIEHGLDGIYGLLANAHGFSGCPRNALAAADKSAKYADTTQPGVRAALIFQRCTGLMSLGHYDEAVAAGQAAQKILDELDPVGLPAFVSGAMIGSRACQNVLAFQGYRPDPVIRDAGFAISQAVGDFRPFTLLMPFGIYATWSGRLEDSVAYLEETTQKARRTGAPPYPYALYIRAHLHWQRGDFAGALAHIDHALAYPHVEQLRLAQSLLRSLRGLVLVDLGRHDEALATLEALVADAGEVEMSHVVMLGQLGLGYAALARNDVAAARGPLEAAYRTAEEGPARNPLTQAQAGRLLGQVVLREGDLGRARRLFEEALAIAERPEIDNPLEQAHAHLAIADAAKARGDRPAATAALARAGDLFHQLRNPHWLHVTTRAIEDLSQTSTSVPAATTSPAGEAGVEARWKFVRGAML